MSGPPSTDSRPEPAGEITGPPPAPLHYATAASRAVSRRLSKRWLLAALAFVLLVVIAETGIDYGHRYQSCVHCGARRRVNHFVFFGMGGDYGEVLQAGPVSLFVQKHNGSPCAHRWESYDLYGGSPLRRWAGVGGGLARYVWIGRLESCPSLPALLVRRASADPAFLDTLKTAIAFDDPEAAEAVFEELFAELTATSFDHARR